MSEAAGTLTAAVDIGGTFTDCIIVADDGRVAYGKALSSPADDFQSGFFGSLEAAAGQLGHTGEDLFDSLLKLISHGSTVATNIVVEERGANVGLLTTLGHEDTLQMMRGVGRITGEPPENILKITETFKPTPLVPRHHVAGLVERVDSTGKVLVELDEAGLREAVTALAADGCDAFAVALLWSIQNPAHELRAREIINEIAPDAFVSVSHEISKSVGEYERTVATVINALVGPRTSQYLNTLDDRARRARLRRRADADAVPRRHGAACSDGRRLPVLTIGSGPVGGLVGTQRLAADLGVPDVIATDMGGTSFDVGLLKDGEPLVALDTTLGKWNYRVPAVEVLSIGAGGGSIAWVDPQGTSLRVGPHSASSNPGPACYGRGGEEPTVTDANLVLGYVDPEVVFGTAADGRSIHPDRDLAEAAIARVAEPLGLSVVDAALGIVEIANTKMANLLENVVIGRGFDPRDFLLVSYGGSGPLHAAGYARALGDRPDRDPRRGRVGLERLRHRPVGRPLPRRARRRAALALRPGGDAERLRGARSGAARGLGRRARAGRRRRPDPPPRPHALRVAAQRARGRTAARRPRRGRPRRGHRGLRERLRRTLRLGRAAARRPPRDHLAAGRGPDPGRRLERPPARPARAPPAPRSRPASSPSSAAPSRPRPRSTTATACSPTRSSTAPP